MQDLGFGSLGFIRDSGFSSVSLSGFSVTYGLRKMLLEVCLLSYQRSRSPVSPWHTTSHYQTCLG